MKNSLMQKKIPIQEQILIQDNNPCKWNYYKNSSSNTAKMNPVPKMCGI